MPDDTHNVFISHIHEDDAGLADLKDLLSKRSYTLRDSSITGEKPNQASDPNYIKSEILAPRIKWAGTLLVYITPETCDSPWIDWEIEYAHKLGKRIVGVWGHGDAECEVPDALDKYADAVVGWDSDRIIRAIDGTVNDWTTQNGEPRVPRPIDRYSCT